MAEISETRREAIKIGTGGVATALAYLSIPDFVFPGQNQDEELVPFLDMPRTPPNRLDWETLDSWITPQDQVFSVQHYGTPDVDHAAFQLELTGRIDHPRTISLDQLKSLPVKEQLMTLECSGNGASKGFMNAVYNGNWRGTPLAPILKECGLQSDAREVVFFGFDNNVETLREGTDRELSVPVPFGRSMSLDDAMNLNLLLAYERNGKPLEKRNGAPLRLIVPGWYGIANIKWLKRIEIRDSRCMGRFMGRDYVTVRGHRNGGEVEFVETSVSRMNLKSIVARITTRGRDKGDVLKSYGAAWDDGTGISKVQVQVNGGQWQDARLDETPRSPFSWVFFSMELGALKPGKHRVVSRAIDVNGRIQPSAQEDEIALKKTYWEAYQQWPREIEVSG